MGRPLAREDSTAVASFEKGVFVAKLVPHGGIPICAGIGSLSDFRHRLLHSFFHQGSLKHSDTHVVTYIPSVILLDLQLKSPDPVPAFMNRHFRKRLWPGKAS
jgi:hypothetical protein